MKDIICNAIKNKSCLEFNYDGSKRLVEPHAFVYNKQGKPFVKGWEISENDINKNEWSNYSPNKISNILVSETISQAPRRDYKPYDPKIYKIICQL